MAGLNRSVTQIVSTTHDKIGVTNIGRKSIRVAGVSTFGTGEITADSHRTGKTSELREQLNKRVTSSTPSNEHLFPNGS